MLINLIQTKLCKDNTFSFFAHTLLFYRKFVKYCPIYIYKRCFSTPCNASNASLFTMIDHQRWCIRAKPWSIRASPWCITYGMATYKAKLSSLMIDQIQSIALYLIDHPLPYKSKMMAIQILLQISLQSEADGHTNLLTNLFAKRSWWPYKSSYKCNCKSTYKS